MSARCCLFCQKRTQRWPKLPLFWLLANGVVESGGGFLEHQDAWSTALITDKAWLQSTL